MAAGILRAFHFDFYAVEVGGEMPGVGQGHCATGLDPHGEAGRVGAASADESPVQCVKDQPRIGAALRRAADRSNEKRDEHSGLKVFAGHITGDDQHAAVELWKDLKEIAAHFSGKKVFGFDS